MYFDKIEPINDIFDKIHAHEPMKITEILFRKFLRKNPTFFKFCPMTSFWPPK